MRPLTFRAIVSILTFTLGVTAAAVWSARYFYYSARPPAGAAQPEWKEVDIDGKVTFRVPANLTTALIDTTSPYRAFRREGMDISVSRENIHTGGTCVIHGEENLSKSKVKRMRVAGRDATVLNLEVAAFGPQHLYDSELLKGMTVCVPDVGDGEHEFSILARYKDERDYQDVLRIIDSIEFH
jgi:hypothetical protein